MSLFLTPIEEAVLEEVLDSPREKGKASDIIEQLIDSIKPSTTNRTGYARYEKKEAPGLFTEPGFLILATDPFDGAIKFEIPAGISALKLEGAYLLQRGHPLFLKTADTAVVLDVDGENIEKVVEATFQAEPGFPTMVLNQGQEFYNKVHSKTTGRFAPRGGGRALTGKEEKDFVAGLSPSAQKRYAKIKAHHEKSNSRSLVAGKLPNGKVVPVSVENERTFGQKAAHAALVTALVVGYVALRVLAAQASSPSSRSSGGYRSSSSGGGRSGPRDTPESHRAKEREKVNDYAKNLREQRRKEKAASGGTNKDFRSTGFRSETGAAPSGRLMSND